MSIRDSEAFPAARAGQRSTAAPSGIDRNIAGMAIDPISTPISRWLRPKRVTSSGINGGTAKKVTPTAKKLTTVDASISQRREVRSYCMEGMITPTIGKMAGRQDGNTAGR